MSYLSRKLSVQLPDWLYKVAIAIVMIRLTLAPWLEDYAQEQLFLIHWTLVIYPLVLVSIWFARQYNPSATLQGWLTGAFLHVTALLLTTETSYQLTGEYPNFLQLNFHEAVLLAMNWMILACIYFWRSGLSGRLKTLYQVFGYGLLTAGLALHLDVSLVNSPFVEATDTGAGLLWNWLLPQWAIPTLLLVALVYLNLTEKRWHKAWLSLAGVF